MPVDDARSDNVEVVNSHYMLALFNPKANIFSFPTASTLEF